MSRISFNLLGAQGSGKGTQAKALIHHFNLVLFDAGEKLREIRSTGSPLGKEIASYIDGGNRVPPELIANVTREALADSAKDHDILFDGLLRSLPELEPQKKVLDELDVELPTIIFLNLDEEIAIERLSKRRICTGCSSRYMFTENLSPAACERCGGHLEQRHDDTPEAIRRRLAWYHDDTLPVVEHFRKQGKVIDIDAAPAIDVVTQELVGKVTDYYKSRDLRPPLRD